MAFDDLAEMRRGAEAYVAQGIAIINKMKKQQDKMVEKVLKEFATALWGKNKVFFSTPIWSYQSINFPGKEAWTIAKNDYKSAVESMLNRYGQQAWTEIGKIPLSVEQDFSVQPVIDMDLNPFYSICIGGEIPQLDYIGIRSADDTRASLEEALRKLHDLVCLNRQSIENVPLGKQMVYGEFILKRKGITLDIGPWMNPK
ncbi:hypothetical protein [Herpetosiphon llansteffanensis]|uniref:hypothetical protein n=1 Tax=Herpetosiphon llansteffanensis TaxID=2094568 RepID=UPI000D7C46D5|nr:hypothetical protein [Herpetosiphon llansteffanensis]